jgi:hypothetical protein
MPHVFPYLPKGILGSKTIIQSSRYVGKILYQALTWKLLDSDLPATTRGSGTSVADPDPGSGANLTPASGIRERGWVKKIRIRIRDEQPGSYFLEHLKNHSFKLKYLLKFFDADPGWKKSSVADP